MAARSPSAWGAYLTVERPPSPAAGVFRARFRMASAFAGAEFRGLSRLTANAYSAVSRCVLVYSTWEALRTFTGAAVAIDSPELAERFRASRGLLDYLRSNTDEGVARSVDRVATGRSDNVRYVLAAVRHLHAHGAWTPTGAGFTSQRSISLLNDLAGHSLQAVDAAFTDWLASRPESRKVRTA